MFAHERAVRQHASIAAAARCVVVDLNRLHTPSQYLVRSMFPCQRIPSLSAPRGPSSTCLFSTSTLRRRMEIFNLHALDAAAFQSHIVHISRIGMPETGVSDSPHGGAGRRACRLNLPTEPAPWVYLLNQPS